ncbi:MAG: alpha/beta fold hydrolase [Pseudomonadota bacterium]
MRSLLIFLCLSLAACAPRGTLKYAAPDPRGTVEEIWVANFRPTQPPAEGQRSPPRPDALRFRRNDVSVPPTHRTGQVEWPKGAPDAATDFVTLRTKEYQNIGHFARQIARADQSGTKETLIFVHGYNVTHGEAVYQLAQVAHDFEIEAPTVLFSWPSAGATPGYIYDRDSVLIARDQLEKVIVALTRDPSRQVILMGHSMGNLLLMETLRQIEISGSLNIARKIDGLFMVSPDIDGELFYTQAARLDALPDPTIILAADQDRALRVSAFLTGRTNRLGSQTDRSSVRDLPISVVDVSSVANGGLDHSVALTSPAAIAIIRNLNRKTLPGEAKVPPLVDLATLGQ